MNHPRRIREVTPAGTGDWPILFLACRRRMLFPIMMKILPCSLALLAVWASAVTAGAVPSPTPASGYVVDHRHSPRAVLRPLPLDAVEWTTGFWAERHRQLCEVTLGESWRLLADAEAGHVLENFRLATRPGVGGYQGTTWQDEWLYKWIEAAACAWRRTRDATLERRMDEGIALIAATLQPDGYLSTMPIVLGKPRLQNPHDHEVYNMGHLLTAAVVHHRMTGKDTLLKVACRVGDFLATNLGVTVEPFMAHNPSAVMGLVELYRATGEKKYLAAAQLIVDRRGTKAKRQSIAVVPRPINGTDLIQDRVPIRDSTEVVGHNVFFTYLYAGAADLCAEAEDARLRTALDRLWADVTQRKMFINGGVSAIPRGWSNNGFVNEAAGAPYQLPNATCYNETCGQIGMMMWGQRMLAYQPDGRLADVIERQMYNGVLPSISLDGRNWFYRAILRRYDANYQATGWTDMVRRGQPGRTHICCPSNYVRTIAELSSYFYSTDDRGLWVHQYGGTKVSCQLASGEDFSLEQVTDYPWRGDVKIIIRQAPAKPVALRLRVPGWAATAKLALNGSDLTLARGPQGYLEVEQPWKRGDTLTLSLPLDAQMIAADPRVEETRNQLAIVRGPIVYCVESPDLPSGVEVASIFVPQSARFEPAGYLRGADLPLARSLVALRGPGLFRPEAAGGPLYRPINRAPMQSLDLTLIPYFAWANRGKSAMTVWLPVVWQK